jgi:Flp pilus assembly protein TadD
MRWWQIRRAMHWFAARRGEAFAAARLDGQPTLQLQSDPLNDIASANAPPLQSTAMDWQPYALSLHRLVLREAERHPREMLESLLEFGDTLYNARRVEQAAALWQRGTEIAPQNPVYWSVLGVARLDLKRYAESEAAFRRALAIAPGHAGASHGLGMVLTRLERFAENDSRKRKKRTVVRLRARPTSHNSISTTRCCSN